MGKKNKFEKGKTTEQIRDELIKAIEMPVTKEDLELLEEVKKGARKKCVRGLHHTYSIILGRSGKYHEGIQQTYRRFKSICPEENIFVVTSFDHKNLVTEQLGIDPNRVLAEPLRRNTAPCIA